MSEHTATATNESESNLKEQLEKLQKLAEQIMKQTQPPTWYDHA